MIAIVRGSYLELALGAAAVLVGIALVGGALLFYRRRIRSGQENAPAPGWTLEGLRELHARGDLNEQEYQFLCRQVMDELEGDGPGE